MYNTVHTILHEAKVTLVVIAIERVLIRSNYIKTYLKTSVRDGKFIFFNHIYTINYSELKNINRFKIFRRLIFSNL